MANYPNIGVPGTMAAPGASPITPNAASQKQFDADYGKLNRQSLTEQQVKAVLVYSLIYFCNTAVGIDYRTNHKGLIQDIQVWTAGLSNFDFFAGLAAVTWSAANALHSGVSGNVPTILQEMRDILEKSSQDLDRMIVFLAAQTGV